MKAAIQALLLIVVSGVCQCQSTCTLEGGTKKPFPDLFKKAPNFFQMAVEYTLVPDKETSYYTEYFDVGERKGRVDALQKGKSTSYYYYNNALEAFEISGTTCVERNQSHIPEFMDAQMTEWIFSGDKYVIHGPSAMFAYANQSSNDKVVYMGNSESPVRGIPAVYWKRCIEKDVTAEYYFSAPSHEDMYGIKDLKEIPLRIKLIGKEPFYPQNYEIVSFAPFLDNGDSTFELPTGFGCGRKPREEDIDIPSFQGKNLFVYGEAAYQDTTTADGKSYNNNFMFALDVASNHLSYFSSPWVVVDGQTEAGGPEFVVYDTLNKYIYRYSFNDGQCTISNIQKYAPKYVLPENRGFVSLTDSSVFFPNNEFYYLGDGVDRGYRVSIFESTFIGGYILGDKLIDQAVVTHYYLKDTELKRGAFPTEEALSRVRISLNNSAGTGNDKFTAVLNFNMFAFSTQIDRKSGTFDISSCFINDDDFMLITIGFPADDAVIQKISNKIPSIEENIQNVLETETEIKPARLPHVLVDLTNGVYVTLYLLQRPPVALDFAAEPLKETTIKVPAETQGIISLEDCANLCLESNSDCWGFAYCGSSCYIGAGENNATETKAGCIYHTRTNFNPVPRLKTLRRNLERLVSNGRLKIVVPVDNEAPVELTANYIGDAVFGESQEIFDLMGFETDDRLKVVKVGTKLKADAGEAVKNFGRLTYGECQRMCLDYKACDTVSYCLTTKECILSKTYGEDIAADKMQPDNFCNLLTRRYSDKFVRSPGNVVSQTARKVLSLSKEEDCARACAKETSFDCMSFDHCQGGENSCRLHTVHILDLKTNEGGVTKNAVCGHYSRKYTYDFKRDANKMTVGHGVLVSSGVTVEECAKTCVDYAHGTCLGFDLCQDKALTKSTCTVLTKKANEMTTTVNNMCSHFTRDSPIKVSNIEYSNATAGGVGFLVFVIGCFIGGLIVFGIAYCRVNRKR